MRNIIVLLCFSCEMNPAILNRNNGSSDSVAPACVLATTIPDPVLTDSVLCTATFSKGPISGFATADFTLTNCTISDFTQVSGNVWTFLLNPTIDGTFTAKVNAATCTWTSTAGVAVSNLVSNTLSKIYDSGASYDLENAAEISLSQHYRGHTWSICHSNDLASVVSVPGMELLCTKYNFGATHFANGNSQASRDMYDFGRTDFGVYPLSFADYQDKETIVQAIMDGQLPTVVGYKNGTDSYWADLIPYILVARNATYGGPTNSATPSSYSYYEYSGLTQEQLLRRGITYRPDYGDKVTTTSYYICSNAIRDANMAAYISYVSSNNGKFHSFVHWHWQKGNYPKHYFNQLVSGIGSSDPYRGTLRTIEEYYYVKESVTSVTGNGNTLTVNHSKDFAMAPYERITTPVWIKVNLTGTVFAGEDIALSNGLKPRHISGNTFYIPLMLDFSGSSSSVSLGIATSAPDYVNLNAPVINRTGSAVTSDIACRFTVWRVAKPTSLASSVTSATIPTADNTTVNLTVATGLTIPAGTEVKVTSGANYFYASVTSYTSGTGALVLSSYPDPVGSGTFSSWTIQTYYHELAATVVERSFTLATSYTILATLDEVNYTYYVGGITADGISNVTP